MGSGGDSRRVPRDVHRIEEAAIGAERGCAGAAGPSFVAVDVATEDLVRRPDVRGALVGLEEDVEGDETLDLGRDADIAALPEAEDAIDGKFEVGAFNGFVRRSAAKSQI